MKMYWDWVCVGDSTANLHLLDLKNDLKLVKFYSTAHTKHTGQIIGVHMDGCLITVDDHAVRFSSLTDPPQTMMKLGYNQNFRVSIIRIYRKKTIFMKYSKILLNLDLKKLY